MRISIVIATNNRAADLLDCLDSLKLQSAPPDEVLIAHGGGDIQTKNLVEEFSLNPQLSFKLKYFNFGPLGAARQRNRGAVEAIGEIIFFIDDDIICDTNFIKEIMQTFDKDARGDIGGISGAIVNQTYVPFGPVNKFLFDLCLSKKERFATYSGKLIGPAVNFLPVYAPNLIQKVDWIPSCCSAYRRGVFLSHQFNETFSGYSFMEDVELSSRVAKKYALVNVSNASVYHKDLGGKTHKNWVNIGKMQVVNRWGVMTKVLNKKNTIDIWRFIYYQFYCIIVEFKLLKSWAEARNTLMRWYGRLLALLDLWHKAVLRKLRKKF